MRHVVLGYPTLDQTDFEWIQSIRITQDPHFDAVDPHFTFVFPTEKLSAQELVDHTELKALGQPRIAFTLTKVSVVEDDSEKSFHAFLVPSIGQLGITEIHDVLYTDSLASELRLDIRFIPHIGVASNKQRVITQELAEDLNSEPINIKGVIEALTVSSYDGIRVKDIKRVPLA